MSFSLMFCCGTYGGFRFENGKSMKRLVLGFFAFTVAMPEYDVRFNKLIDFYEVNNVGELVRRTS